MVDHAPCPNCARSCRRDRTDAAGRIICASCGTDFLPTESGDRRPTTVSLAGVADDFETKLLPKVVPKPAHLSHSEPAIGVTLSAVESAGVQRPSVAELLHDGNNEKYIIDHELGRGGMGAVLRVVDRDLHRDVAMKVLLGEQGARDRRHFVEEAQITGQLEHPNIVPIHDIGVDANQRLYFTMKLVRGRSLSDVLDLVRHQAAAGEEFTRFRLLRIFIQICNAVAFAHARGVVHRDLKPSNVMLGDFGEVLVADWGLARVLPAVRSATKPRAMGKRSATTQQRTAQAVEQKSDGSDRDDRLAAVVKSFRRTGGDAATVQGTIEGTPVYMPPEQALGDLASIDERSDIYSLGAILYEILTLSPPVEGRDVDAVLDNVINHRIQPPNERAPNRDIPLDLSAIAQQALAAEREHRYQRVIDLRKDIEAHLDFRSVSAREDTALEILVRVIRRHRAAALVGFVSLFVLTIVLAVTFSAIRRERDRLASANSQLTEEKLQREHEQKRAAPALVAKAKQATAAREWAEAFSDTELATQYDPHLTSALLLRAQLKVHQRDWVRAREQLDRYLQLAPDDEDAQRLAGLCREAAQDENSAVVIAIADRLVRMGMGTLAEDLFMRGQDRIAVYRKQLEQAFPGSTQRGFTTDKDGMLTLNSLGDRQDVIDLSPLAGMPIVRLRIQRTKVIDLSPLKGMPLSDLDISNTPARDLSPLRGMSLLSLNVSGSRVDDLEPLSGMAIEDLDISLTSITSLEPLRQMPLRVLRAMGTQVSDITALAGAPMHEVDLTGTMVEDLSVFSGSKVSTLLLSNTPVSDLTPLVNVPLTRLAISRTRITDLKPLSRIPLRQLQLAGCPIVDLRPLTGMALTELDLNGLPINDLTPLSGMPLASLNLTNTLVSDLTPLARLRLTWLGLAGTKVRDLKPLTGLPLNVLELSRTPVNDLTAIARCPIQTLLLDGSAVADLKPLAKTPLAQLRIDGAPVTDLTPLVNCPIERLVFSLPVRARDLKALHSIPTLRQIGTVWDGNWLRLPVNRLFWERADIKTIEAGP